MSGCACQTNSCANGRCGCYKEHKRCSIKCTCKRDCINQMPARAPPVVKNDVLVKLDVRNVIENPVHNIALPANSTPPVANAKVINKRRNSAATPDKTISQASPKQASEKKIVIKGYSLNNAIIKNIEAYIAQMEEMPEQMQNHADSLLAQITLMAKTKKLNKNVELVDTKNKIVFTNNK